MLREIDFNEVSDGKFYSCNDMAKTDCGGCQGCSSCCQGMGNSIILDPWDAYQLQTNLNQTFESLLTDHVELNITDAALDLLADEGYDPEFGARPVKRVIQKEILNQLSKDILAGKIDKEKGITIDASGGKFLFRN